MRHPVRIIKFDSRQAQTAAGLLHIYYFCKHFSSMIHKFSMAKLFLTAKNSTKMFCRRVFKIFKILLLSIWKKTSKQIRINWFWRVQTYEWVFFACLTRENGKTCKHCEKTSCQYWNDCEDDRENRVRINCVRVIVVKSTMKSFRSRWEVY